MSDDPVLKMYETQAELETIKKEIKEIQKQNDELKNEITLKNLIETVNEVQSKVDVLQQTVTALSNRVSNYDEIFSELDQNLRKINGTLNKDNTIRSQHNDVPAEQNGTTQVLNASANNLGDQNFILLIYFQEKQMILLLGGEDKSHIFNTLLMLESDGENWKQLNIRLPYAIFHHGAQFLNNTLYIFGGIIGRKSSNCTCKLSKSLQWERLADMNEKRWGISNNGVILNNQIWVLGGDNEKERLRSVEMYDPETNEWKYMKEMNCRRRYAAAAVVNGKIFCSGGNGDSVEYYDPSSNVWTFISNMPRPTNGHGAIEMNGHFIVVGGFCFTTMFNNVCEWDTTDKNAEWIEKQSMPIPCCDFSIAKIDDKVFICGGWNKECLDDVQILDGGVWKSGPKMPTTQQYAPAVVVPAEFARSLN